MKQITITEEAVKAAMAAAKSEETKEVLSALFGRTERVKPTLADYTTIKSYEDACEALDEAPILDAVGNYANGNSENVPNHIIALMKLETISRALWGFDWEPKPKAEGGDLMYYPWFALWTKEEIEEHKEQFIKKGALLSGSADNGAYAGFGYLHAFCRSSYAYANIGFRLCQETEEKALYFGKQFIQLWAEYLAFNFEVGGDYFEENK